MYFSLTAVLPHKGVKGTPSNFEFPFAVPGRHPLQITFRNI